MYKIIGADQKQYGPVSADELRQWIAEGRVNAQTLIQAEGQTDWRPLSSFPEFASTAQPLPSGTPLTTAPASTAQSLVNGPGIALMIVGIIYALGALLGIVGALVWGSAAFAAGTKGPMRDLPPEVVRMMQSMQGTGLMILFPIIQLLLSAFITFGSIKMRKLESYGLVMTATILSMIPCITPNLSCIPCCILGLPLGIWSLVALSKPEVKAAFH
jgi:hypothetical protein